MRSRVSLAAVAVLLLVPAALSQSSGEEDGWLELFEGSLTEEFYSVLVDNNQFTLSGGKYLATDPAQGGTEFELDNTLDGSSAWNVTFELTLPRPSDPSDTNTIGAGLWSPGGLSTGTQMDTIQVLRWQGASAGDKIEATVRCGGVSGSLGTLSSSPTGDVATGTFTVTHEADGTTTCDLDLGVHGGATEVQSSTTDRQVQYFNAGSASDASAISFDNWLVEDGIGTHFVSVAPLAPTGVSAIVTEAVDTSDTDGEEAEIELRWLLSPNDPDQDVGELTYTIFINGVQSSNDAVSGMDGDGQRFNLVLITSNAQTPQPTDFKIRATNTTSGLSSSFSCTVTVDFTVLGDSDTCGQATGFGGLDFTTPTDTAAGLRGFIVTLMGDSAATLFLGGLILVVIVFLGTGAAFAALAGAPGMPAVVAGSVSAFGMMIFLVVAQIWSLGAAAIIILMSTGVALSLMRRLFFGGGGGGG